MYSIVISRKADKVLQKWKKSNPQLFKKAALIFNDIRMHPREGIGHPEPLIGGNEVVYSRRISAKDRVIYEVHDNIVEVDVITIEGHYEDK